MCEWNVYIDWKIFKEDWNSYLKIFLYNILKLAYQMYYAILNCWNLSTTISLNIQKNGNAMLEFTWTTI